MNVRTQCERLSCHHLVNLRSQASIQLQKRKYKDGAARGDVACCLCEYVYKNPVLPFYRKGGEIEMLIWLESYTYNGILFGNENELITTKFNNIDKCHMQNIEKKLDRKGTYWMISFILKHFSTALLLEKNILIFEY